MNFRRLTAVCLTACLLLPGCSLRGGPGAQLVPSVHTGVVAYVPLDDRPDNAERVVYLANSLGYQLDMPEEDLYKTRLDAQSLNANATQYGDRAALYEWVLSKEEAGCNRYILSLDQLLSGGLVNSRAMEKSQPVTLSDGTVLSEAQLLERLLKTLANDPNNRVWLLDSVMRLAPTAGYAGFGLNEYNALRAYGMEPRPTLSGSSLTVENIVADYSLRPNGTLIACRSDSPLPDNAVKNYLAARERKLLLCDEAERILSGAGYENFHLLIGIDDSSSEDSIQKNEIAYLRAGLRTASDGTKADWLLSGVDDLGFKAITKLYLEESGWAGGTVRVRYYGGMENAPACDYDYNPLSEIVEEHLGFFGLTEAEDGGELELLILTRSKAVEKQETYYQALINQLNENEKSNRPTILMDASNGTCGTDFHDALVKQCRLGWLLSYSGFLDMAIVTGTALSHGVARYAWLQNGNGGDEGALWAFQKTLTESVVLDFAYKNVVREEVISSVRELGGDANNFCSPPLEEASLIGVVSDGMEKVAAPILKNLAHSNFITELKPYGVAGWGTVSLSNWSFPWSRSFEVRMDITLGAPVSAHKKILFFYT